MFERLPLKDIHLPDPVSWWPPAIGWWLLPVVVLLLAFLIRRSAGLVRRLLARRRLRRQALRELERIRRDYETEGDPARALRSLSILMRRVAITVFPDQGVPGRSGRAWLEWLARTGPERFDRAPLEALLDGPYRPAVDLQAAPVFDAARRWIRHATRRPS